jgi:hypothetical protein
MSLILVRGWVENWKSAAMLERAAGKRNGRVLRYQTMVVILRDAVQPDS